MDYITSFFLGAKQQQTHARKTLCRQSGIDKCQILHSLFSYRKDGLQRAGTCFGNLCESLNLQLGCIWRIMIAK